STEFSGGVVYVSPSCYTATRRSQLWDEALPPPPAPAAPAPEPAVEPAAAPLPEVVQEPNERLRKLEDKIRILEQEKAIESCANALAVLRRHLNRPPSLFDRHEAVELLETLVRLARTQAHDKADEYAAALDEVKARQPSIEPDPTSHARSHRRPAQG
ncbi:hypothetical protein OS493_038204, partial [Desmophyllum pertusum]